MLQRPDYSQCRGDLAAVNRAFEQCFDVRFIHKVFSVQPSLKTMDEFGDTLILPFTGADYDPEKYEVVDDGWDHDHCYICFQRIEVGDEYWANELPGICPDLCTFCYQELMMRRP